MRPKDPFSQFRDFINLMENRVNHLAAVYGSVEKLAEARGAIRELGGGEARIAPYAVPGTELRHAAVIIEKSAPTPAAYPRRWAKISKKPQ